MGVFDVLITQDSLFTQCARMFKSPREVSDQLTVKSHGQQWHMWAMGLR